MIWIKDEEFIRGKVPMTKYDVRVLTCHMLDLDEDTSFLDIGAGTGSISIQGAKLASKAWAIESKLEAVDLIKKNREKHKVDLEVIHGMAPAACPDLIFDRVFIGGSRGNLPEIFEYLEGHLADGGIVVANFVTLNNAAECKKLMKDHGYEFELKVVQISYEDHLEILRGQNPIFMMKGVKA